MNPENILKLLKNKNNQLLFIILIIGMVLIFASGEKEDMPDKTTNEEQRLEEILTDKQKKEFNKIKKEQKKDMEKRKAEFMKKAEKAKKSGKQNNNFPPFHPFADLQN